MKTSIIKTFKIITTGDKITIVVLTKNLNLTINKCRKSRNKTKNNKKNMKKPIKKPIISFTTKEESINPIPVIFINNNALPLSNSYLNTIL